LCYQNKRRREVKLGCKQCDIYLCVDDDCWCYSLVFSCMKGQWWLWSDDSWVYIFLFNQCLTLLKFWVLLQPVLYVLWFPRPIELNKHNETEILLN
jgi:hypothetical protein